MAEAVPENTGTESTPAREPQIGDRVGPYPILGELGRGGMAVVYRSKDPVLPREIALKIMLPKAFATDPQAKARFLREAGAQAKVQHHHVVVIYQAGEWNGIPYIAMPCLKGRTLAALLKELRDSKERLPVAEVVRIGREIAEGLEAAHAAGLVHRDIKPGNVWLEDPKRWVKLLDFGLAREESVAPEVSGKPVAKKRAIVGTPSYMSPEQATGGAVDARTDLWSLGVVLYQMLTGEKPFTGATRHELIRSVIEDEPLPPSAPDLPPALVELIRSLLAKHPDDRPRTATQVAEALAAIAKALHAPPVVQLPAPATVAAPELWGALDDTDKEDEPKTERGPSRPRPRPREDEPRSLLWAWIAGGSLLGVLLLGVLIWLAVKPSKPKPAPKEETAAVKPAVSPERKPPEKKPPEKKQPEPTPPTPPTPPPTPPAPLPALPLGQIPVPAMLPNDRKVAEIFHEMRPLLQILPEGATATSVVRPGEPLPGGKFALVEIDLRAAALPGDYTGETFLTDLAGLKLLVILRITRSQLNLSAEQVRAMAAMPLAATLQILQTDTELTPQVLAEIKKLGALRQLQCRVSAPDDALFAKLGVLKLQSLTLAGLQESKNVTEKGWLALGKLPLAELYFIDPKLDTAAVRALTAKGGQRRLGFVRGELEDDALLELSRHPSDLAELMLCDVKGVTDASLLHLAKVPSLKRLMVSGNAITNEGIQALQKERPELTIQRVQLGPPG